MSDPLLQAACLGDPEAIEQLLLQVQPSITQFARKFCATPEDVEDAVQETLWVVYQKIGTLRASAAFVSWAFQIVRHHCYRLLSFKYHEMSEISISKLDYLDYTEDDPELYTLLKQDVVSAIAHLPSAYRQVLVMRDLEGFTAPEVAQRLHLTLETVKSRLHRARGLLRQQLSHWGEIT